MTHEQMMRAVALLVSDRIRGCRRALLYCREIESKAEARSCPAYDFNVGPRPIKPGPPQFSACLEFAYGNYVYDVTDAVQTYQDLACLLCWDGSAFDSTCIDVLRESLGETLDALYDDYCDEWNVCVGT